MSQLWSSTKPIVLMSGKVMTFGHCTEKSTSFECIQDKKSLLWHVQQQPQHPHSMSSGRPSVLEVVHFGGMDVGCEHSNLTFIMCELKDKKNPIFEVLNTLLPAVIGGDTHPENIEKALLYFDSESACS
jgi:hypothetical protein